MLVLLLALIVIIIEPTVTKQIFNIYRKGGTSSLVVTLKSGEGKVYIDNKYYGTTPLSVHNISSGVHSVKIIRLASTSNFYSPFLETIPFEGNNATIIEWNMGPSSNFSSGAIFYFKNNFSSSSSINLSVNTKSEIFINKKYIKTSSFLEKILPPGAYNITLASPGYIQKSIEVNLKEGYDVYVKVQLFEIPLRLASGG